MKIYAHRGSSGNNPEMTKSAYLAAISDGADGFECDVRLTKDREIALAMNKIGREYITKNIDNQSFSTNIDYKFN